MNKNGPLWRALALAGLMVGGAAAPAMAGQADIDFLGSYLGNWKGRGQLQGANTETVVCKLSLSAANNNTKINYSGRCTLAGNNLAVNGTVAYIDAKRRYEAVMTSNASFTGTAIGQRQGNGVVFNLREKERDEAAKRDMTITSSISLLDNAISVEFLVVDDATGDTIRASVPFTK